MWWEKIFTKLDPRDGFNDVSRGRILLMQDIGNQCRYLKEETAPSVSSILWPWKQITSGMPHLSQVYLNIYYAEVMKGRELVVEETTEYGRSGQDEQAMRGVGWYALLACELGQAYLLILYSPRKTINRGCGTWSVSVRCRLVPLFDRLNRLYKLRNDVEARNGRKMR
jgi:hypothetical protein